MARVSALPSNCRQWLLARATWPTRRAFPADRRSMMGMCEASKPDDDELISVAKSYLSMNESRIFSSETANDPGMYIFLSARLDQVRLTRRFSRGRQMRRYGYKIDHEVEICRRSVPRKNHTAPSAITIVL